MQNIINLNVWKRIFQTPYGLLLSICIGALGMVLAAISPLTSVAVSDGAGFDKYGIAVYFMLNAIFGITIIIISGYLSDGRIARYKLVLVSGFLGALGYIGIATITGPIHAFIAGLLSVFTGILFPQLFAVSREGVFRSWDPDEQTVGVTSLRTLFSLGFVFGTGIASAMTRVMPIQTIFLALTPAMLLLTLFSAYVIKQVSPATAKQQNNKPLMDRPSVPVGTMPIIKHTDHVDQEIEPVAEIPTEKPSQPVGAVRDAFPWLSFSLLLAAIVVMRGGDSARSIYLPLAMRKLFNDAGIAPLMFGMTAAAELITMGLVGAIAQKIGNRTTIAAGALIGVLYYVMMALSSSLPVLYLANVIYALYVAALMGVGMAHVQAMLADRAGLGTSVYMACLQIGSMVGILGPLVIPGINQTIFFAPAAMCLTGAIIMGLTAIIERQRDRRTVAQMAAQTASTVTSAAKSI